MTVMTMIEAIRSTIRQEMLRDDKVMVLGQDVGKLGGVFRATEGLQAEFGEHRIVDMPLAEASIVGSAIGLSLSGMNPIAEIQFLGFTQQAYHQIVPQLARFRYRSQGRYATPVTIRAPFGGGVRAPELHSDAIESQFTNVPGLRVVMPSTPAEAKGLLTTAVRGEDPVLFCEPLKGYRLVKGEVPDDDYAIPFGELRVAREGTDVTLFAWSAAVQLAEKAADRLAEQGVSAQVVDLRTLVPLDVDGIRDAVAGTGRAVVVHEAPLTSGFGAEVVSTIQEEAFFSLEAPVARVAAPDVPYPNIGIEETFLPQVDRVVAAALKAVNTR
ncbi:alpha-ketoacid dehydrogenase subunit beta [Brevibacterium daeguense]|uniref:Alpha-ketoacid dehydrogenase subunit beta n=1 Tax=Brevibacterium daeguense TaxID=909936 RepID=A0ABP8EFP1_9MICO|nr:alpha-ketoacid dehydrogenase subunit beta [Brevibacterium daeguense]